MSPFSIATTLIKGVHAFPKSGVWTVQHISHYTTAPNLPHFQEFHPLSVHIDFVVVVSPRVILYAVQWNMINFNCKSIFLRLFYVWRLGKQAFAEAKSLYLIISIYKLATVVEGDLKAPFSVAMTLRCRRGHYFFPWIAPLYHWYVPYNAECLARRYQVPFSKFLEWCNLGLNPGLSDHWWTLYPLSQTALVILFHWV